MRGGQDEKEDSGLRVPDQSVVGRSLHRFQQMAADQDVG
jgi:hypothetical protein